MRKNNIEILQERIKTRKKINKRKKYLVIIPLVLVLILLSLFILPIKDGKSFFANITKSEKLAGPILPANYDKMKITFINIRERTTGTASFSSGTESDMNGNDVSATDNYVRTKDNITYLIEVGIDRNEATTEPTETIKGGIIKVKATIPKDESGVNPMFLMKDSWMKDYKYNSDLSEITAYYQIPNDKTAIGGTQQLSFTIKTSLMKKEIPANFTPKFEVWMEGNQPDNAESTAESKILQDSDPLYITGKTVATLNLVKGKINNASELNGVKGQFINYLSRVYTNSGKGTAVPVDHMSSNMVIEYSYRDLDEGTDWIKLTDVAGVDNTNNTILYAYGRAHEPVAGYWPNENSNISNQGSSYNAAYEVNWNSGAEGIRDKWDSGVINANQNGENITYTSDGFYSYGNSTSTLVSAGFELFVPWYEPVEGHHYEYQIKIKDNSLVYQDELGQEYSKDPGTSLTFKFSNYLTGNFSYDLVGYNYYYNLDYSGAGYSQSDYADNKSIPLGKTRYFYSTIKAEDGPYAGGMERLIAWNTANVELNDYYNNRVNLSYSNSGIMETPKNSDATIKYGIYKANPENGLTTDELTNAAVINDFDWYTSYAEAKAAGKITAVYTDEPTWQGYNVSSRINIYLKPIDSFAAVGKSGIIRQKIYVYLDEERTQPINIGEGTDYTPAVLNENATGNAVDASPTNIGETFFITGLAINVTTNNTDMVGSNRKNNYNIEDEIVNMSITPSFSSGVEITEGKATFRVWTTIPNDLAFVEGSSNYTPISIENNTYNATNTKITWEFTDWDLTQPLPVITYQLDISPYSVNNSSKSIRAYISSPSVIGTKDNSVSFTITNLAGSSVRKKFPRKYLDKNEEFTVTDYVYNISQAILLETKTFEILPRDGDDKGSSFSGNYTLRINEIAEDQHLFYTTVDPDSLEYDIDQLGNKHIQSIDILNDSRFIPLNVNDIVPATATMLVSYFAEIPATSDRSFNYTIIPNGNKAGDQYHFQMNSSSSNLENAIHSEIISVYVSQRKISGIAFEDVNRNDIYDTGDRLLNNIAVVATLENSTTVETTTDENGHYEFLLDGPHTYSLHFATNSNYEILPVGTQSNSNKANANAYINDIDHTGPLNSEVVEKGDYNYGIRKKAATLTVKHYIINTTTPLSATTTDTVYYSDTYTTSAATDIPTKYKFSTTSGDPVSEVVSKDNIEVIYFYELKPATLNVKYIDEQGNNVDETKNIHDTTKHYDEDYSSTQLSFTNYNYVGLAENSDAVSGIIAKDEVNVLYVYRLKPATLIVKYVDEQGNNIDPSANINDTTKHWGDHYETEQKTFTNYSFLRREGADANGTIAADTVTVTYVYSLKPATLIVKYVDEQNNDIDSSANINDTTKHWGDHYETEQKTFTNYSFLRREGADAEGTIAADTVTVTYVYKLKAAVVNVYYIDETGGTVSPSTSINDKHWGDTYETEPKDLNDYTYLGLAPDSDQASGTIGKDEINVKYLYRLKDATLIVKYVDENGNNIDESKNRVEQTNWGKPYETVQYTFDNYDFVRQTGDDPNGVIGANTVTVTYEYTLKLSTITVHHYLKGTETNVFPDEVYNKKYTQSYTVTHVDTTDTVYNYDSKIGDEESVDPISQDSYVITYFYVYKQGTVTTHYLGRKTNGDTYEQIAPDISDTYNYTTRYTTSDSDEIPNNYEFERKSDNYTDFVNQPQIDVYYYYREKDSNLTNSISKSAPQEVTTIDEEIEYTITYNASVDEYIGSATITIVDELPYAIDEEKSTLAAGIYNADDNTITWTIPWENIDSYESTNNTKEITITFKVVYTNLDPTVRIMKNNVSGTTELSNNSLTAENSVDTEVNIPSKIKVRYIDTEDNVLEEIEEDGFVGETYIATPIEKPGYKLVETPDEEEVEFTLEEQTLTYVYERIYFVIQTQEDTEGGTVKGAEKVYYGENSTKQYIVITADKGYFIDKVFIDGVEYPIEPNQTEIILDNFKDVQEDHLITASFKTINPLTSNKLNLIFIIVLIISAIFLLSKKVFNIKKYD